tara:strand:+ start:16276 stop:16860 length:585 start_codon:yes stop_codon:yes gene_type:complete
VKLRFPERFLALCNCFFSKTFFIDYANELSAIVSLFKTFLFLIQNLLFSLFFYNIYKLQVQDNSIVEVLFFFQIFSGVSLFLILQFLLGLSVSKIFNFSGLYMSIHTLKFSYLKVISFIMLPLLLYQNYATFDDKHLVGLVVSVLFVFLMLYRVGLIVKKNNKVILRRLFYFIVYLCTLEIVPLLLVYKVAVNK